MENSSVDDEYSILVPPMYSTLRLNAMHPSGIPSILNVLNDWLQQICFNKNLPFTLEAKQHKLLCDVAIIRNVKCKVRPIGKKVIVEESCGMAVLRGADVFIPGVLCMPKDLKAGDEVSIYVDVTGKCLKGMVEFEGKTFFIGNAVSLVSRLDIIKNEVQFGVAFKMNQQLYFTPCFDNVFPDRIFLQNLPSAVVGHVLNPVPGETILDMCAAPGGKSLHLYTLMRGMGLLVSVDRSPTKVEKMRKLMEKWYSDLHNWTSFSSDSTKLLTCLPGRNMFTREYFDGILLDTPCSALGQRPRVISHYSTSKHFLSYPPLQRKLFNTAVALLKRGGRLVYSTCTTTVEENEAMVEWALKAHPCLELCQQIPSIGCSGRDGVTSLSSKDLDCLQFFRMVEPISLDLFEKQTKLGDADQQCSFNEDADVSSLHLDTIGFFIAKFKKE